MTWTKLGDEFSDDCANAGLSDAAYRTHVEAIGWLYRVERMDLHIPKHLLRRFVGSEDWEDAVRDLVALDWWRNRDGHYQLVRHEDVVRQSLAAQQSKRSRDKKAQADKRRRDEAAAHRVSNPVSVDFSADVIPDTDRQTDKQASTASTGKSGSRSREVEFFDLSKSKPSQAGSAPQCSVCRCALSSPLSISEGICAGCENARAAS